MAMLQLASAAGHRAVGVATACSEPLRLAIEPRREDRRRYGATCRPRCRSGGMSWRGSLVVTSQPCYVFEITTDTAGAATWRRMAEGHHQP
jgi:hypothetical protein